MNRLSRNDYKGHSRMNKVCSSKMARSLCGTHRGHDFQRKSANRRKADDDNTMQKKRRSKSVLPPQGQRRSMPQKHGEVAQRRRRATGHNSSRAEIRNQSEYELKMYLEDKYDCVQHTNSLREFHKEPVSQQQNIKVSEKAFSLQEPNLKRDYREADDIQCQPAKQQTSDSQTMKPTKHGNLDMNKFTDVCPKSQASCTRQISEKLLQDDLRNEVTGEKKTKKGFFTNVYRSFLACFGIKNHRK
ncbi:uncharacterized protein LOC132728566 [Ruditapes philippinarum]|uniref:uncharacterized protein LOC132728566 n=1 Tax=Ruditapes philippinarum TaxID=129788 RepID=UPI00295A62B1|nr:uncharacterized protein LOC132728566 [Ruditapes philippinarum]